MFFSKVLYETTANYILFLNHISLKEKGPHFSDSKSDKKSCKTWSAYILCRCIKSVPSFAGLYWASVVSFSQSTLPNPPASSPVHLFLLFDLYSVYSTYRLLSILSLVNVMGYYVYYIIFFLLSPPPFLLLLFYILPSQSSLNLNSWPLKAGYAIGLWYQMVNPFFCWIENIHYSCWIAKILNTGRLWS